MFGNATMRNMKSYKFGISFMARLDIEDLTDFQLTVMRGEDFRLTYQMRMADDLMRYTRMTLAEVARRSGIGSPLNLNQLYRREDNSTSNERRQLRQKKLPVVVGDYGRAFRPAHSGCS